MTGPPPLCSSAHLAARASEPSRQNVNSTSRGAPWSPRLGRDRWPRWAEAAMNLLADPVYRALIEGAPDAILVRDESSIEISVRERGGRAAPRLPPRRAPADVAAGPLGPDRTPPQA